MSQPYILVINGKPEGPFTIEELKARNIKPVDFVKTDEMDDYKEAHEVPELRELFGFKKPPLLVQYFGGFDQRLLAVALDWFFVFGIFIIIAFVIVLGIMHDKESRVATSLAILAVAPFARFIYGVVMESSARQATWGKQIMGIKVVDMYGNRITFGKSLLRSVCKSLSTSMFYFGYFMMFFNNKKQCLHDTIAKTMVIKDRLV
jgi:uncharacterized RDD family membrane protein YckC